MIPIPLKTSFSIYLCLWLIAIAILWFVQEFRKRKLSDQSLVRERLYLCDKCHLSFLAKSDDEHITRCPRCNEMCFIRRRKRF